MTNLIAMGAALLIATAVSAAPLKPKDTLPEAPEGKAWELTWNDEFEADSLDESKWEVPPVRLLFLLDGYA